MPAIVPNRAGADMIDPVTRAVIRGRLEQIVDAMDATLFHAAATSACSD